MSNRLDRIVVLGGGTAGWMTALMVQRHLPKSAVTVIESEEIGILGAGEGTTPMFINFLDYVGISVSDVIANTNATFKNGLKFTNWNGDGEYYYHEFAPRPDALNSHLNLYYLNSFGKHIPFYWLNISEDVPLSQFDFMSMVTDSGLVPFIYRPELIFSTSTYGTYEKVGEFGVHFNATLMAAFLKKVALSRGVNLIEGKVVDVISKDNGDVESLILENDQSIDLDFIFDCSGFSRVLIGKHYKADWESSSGFLPCNSALPFFTEADEALPPFTECISMKHGWMWKIPLQDRYGCGYVFDSRQISEEEAMVEIEEYLGYQPTYPRKDKGSFKFDPGFFKETWIGNCIAIGISSGFMEPLEATNIAVALMNLSDALSDVGALVRRSEYDLRSYNNQVYKLNSEIAEFLYLHYVTQRSDTDFWVDVRCVENYPPSIGEIIKSLDYSIPSRIVFSKWDAFNYGSFYQIALGNGLLNKSLFKDTLDYNNFTEYMIKDFYGFRGFLKDEANKCVDHKTFIKELGGFTNE